MSKRLYFKNMDIYLKKIASELEKASISYVFENSALLIELPFDFGMLEITIWKDDEDSIQLLNGDFHTHSNILALESKTTGEVAIRKFIEKIFNGEILLIEENIPGKPSRRIVEDSLVKYLKYLPEDATYKIFNKI